MNIAVRSRFLAAFAATDATPTVRFSSIGTFLTDPAGVFLAPVVTAELLALHDRFHRRVPDVADQP